VCGWLTTVDGPCGHCGALSDADLFGESQEYVPPDTRHPVPPYEQLVVPDTRYTVDQSPPGVGKDSADTEPVSEFETMKRRRRRAASVRPAFVRPVTPRPRVFLRAVPTTANLDRECQIPRQNVDDGPRQIDGGPPLPKNGYRFS
jgi:hypothetical protein